MCYVTSCIATDLCIYIMSVCKPIDPFVLLIRSESPSQVFMILLKWLLTLMQQVEVPPKVVVAYDNMCNLAKLKVARNPLPFHPPLDSVWHNVDKIVDSFHVKNHVWAKCREQFSPARIKEENPNYNTQAGEQMFVWVGRFKHILCSMNKTHHLFYLQSYECYQNGSPSFLSHQKFSPLFLNHSCNRLAYHACTIFFVRFYVSGNNLS